MTLGKIGGPTPFLPMEKWEKKYMERKGKELISLSFHMLKYMEGEGKLFISLSFHILFSHFSPWEKMGKHTFLHGQKWDWTPQKFQKIFKKLFKKFSKKFSKNKKIKIIKF